mmetsp:Transcript_102300/g.319886  ORF Transcript_102300/g.319886 Transcript_102300/m.319886 type:complete len:470 (-) Transcript_102300:147-1556(-)
MELELPVARCPCRRSASHGACTFLFDDLLGASGVEITKSVKISNPKLGIAKLVLMTVAILWYVFYFQLYVSKGYLSMAPIFGTTRMQLQHPVEHCNPLDDGCLAQFRSADTLPYCKQNPNASALAPETCQYMDIFDLDKDTFQTQQVFMPTRFTYMTQKVLCDSPLELCQNRVEKVKEEVRFVADAERFTLLIDHSFMCKEMEMSLNAWDMLGFVRPCGYPYDCDLVPIPVHPHFVSMHTIPPAVREKVQGMWRASAPAPLNDSFSLPNGDVFAMGYLMSLLGVDLDAPYGLENRTTRQEGMSVIVEIRYSNFVPRSWPNRLPTVYEYRFSRSASETYKSMQTMPTSSKGERLLKDQHGLYFTTRQRGTIGQFELRSTLLMLLETGLILGVVRWVVSLATLNWWHGEAGDQLEGRLADEVEFQIWDGDADAEDGSARAGQQRMVLKKQETMLYPSPTPTAGNRTPLVAQ